MNRVMVVVMLVGLRGFCAAADGDYLLRPGDVLNIQVVSAADLAGGQGTGASPVGGLGFNGLTLNELIIRPDGKISVPLAGELKAAGMTAQELTGVIVERLNRYLVEPADVTVNVVKFHTTRVYVLGEVNHPGLYELEKGGSLVDAIAVAGGWTEEAAKKRVHIIHKDGQGEPLNINLLAVLDKGDTAKNIELVDGDIIYLSDNGKIDFIKNIVPYLTSGYEVRRW